MDSNSSVCVGIVSIARACNMLGFLLPLVPSILLVILILLGLVTKIILWIINAVAV